MNILSKIKATVFAEREIICVSDDGIRSKKIGCVFLVWNVLLVMWTAFATIQYFELRKNIALKEDRITSLNVDKQNLLSNVKILEKNVSNIKNFIVSLNRYDRFVDIDEESIIKSNSGGSIHNDDGNIHIVLDRIKGDMGNINLALVDRIGSLEKIKQDLNINSNIQRVSYEGHLDINDSSVDRDVLESIVLKQTLDSNIDYLNNLESFVNDLPFAEPISSNYVSSKYGKRLDPFIKTPREHHGVDLVGSYMAKVSASAAGKIVFVGDKGGYGKTIVIQHEHNVKTLYGHLYSYNVKVGDLVSRGDTIGVQGNSGRSTGHHLHYEIIKDNQRFNPMDFVGVGNKLY